MPHMRNNRGEVATIVLLAVVLLGGGAWGLSKTKWFSKESKRAQTSTDTTNDLLAAKDKQAAVAAASVVKIGEANQTAPESPEKTFIRREVPVALASLPAPDIEALIAAEKRKVAVLEGRLVEADKLYGDAMERADQYQKEAQRAIAAKRASDLALQQAAAQALGAEQERFWFMLIAIGAGALYLWTKLSHVSPLSLSAAVRDLRTGSEEPNAAIRVLDANLTPFQQMNVALNHFIRRKLDALKEKDSPNA
jgi:hypothetical protein